MTPEKPTYEQIIMLLDACIPALEEAAKREKRRGLSSNGMREITDQERLKFVKEIVDAAQVPL